MSMPPGACPQTPLESRACGARHVYKIGCAAPGDLNTIVQQINEDLSLSLIASWCCHNHLLIINPDKTKLLVMGTRQMLQTLPEFHITLLGKKIAPTASARDLGVQVDAILSYNEHVTNISRLPVWLALAKSTGSSIFSTREL